jgi:dihydroorotase
MCDAPARVWDIVDKGRIAVGYDADLVLVDLNRVAEVRNELQEAKCGWSPWHGAKLTGWPVSTWVMGHLVYRDGEFDRSRRGHEARFDHGRGGYWGTRGQS